MTHHTSERGAVSLFIVVFTVLLLTIVTVSFVRIMLADQEQATTTDLSQSAYDSAQSGVEDAKRALLRYQTECSTGDAARCAAAAIAPVATQQCNEALSQVIGSNVAGEEVIVQQDAGDENLQQAYTCVKISLQTDDVVGSLKSDDTKLIPLISTAAFNTVQIEWFSGKNVSSTTSTNKPVNLQLPGTTPLLRKTTGTGAWPSNRPSIIRAQFMQVAAGGFTLSDIENNVGQNSYSLFLYPIGTTGTARNPNTPGIMSVTARDSRKTPVGTPDSVTCSGNIGSGGYACRVQLVLPNTVPAASRSAFLRLGSLYNTSEVRVSLLDSASPSTLIQFDNVQPLIDSTGRAGDIFRRVQSRVEFTDFPYPDAAVDLTGNFCKNFSVTDTPSDFVNNCTP